MKYRKQILSALLLSTLAIGGRVLAADNNAELPSLLGTVNVNDFAARIINYVLSFIGSIALALFIYGGLLWMTAGGSAAKVEKGQKVIVWSVIGLIVVFFSYIMVRFVMEKVAVSG